VTTAKRSKTRAAIVRRNGGSTNGACTCRDRARAGIDFESLSAVARFSRRRVPGRHFKPWGAGRMMAKDMYEAGGLPMDYANLLDGGLLARRLQ